MKHCITLIVKNPTAHERGATAVEYALMIALITLAIIAAVTSLGLALPGLFQPVSDGLS